MTPIWVALCLVTSVAPMFPLDYTEELFVPALHFVGPYRGISLFPKALSVVSPADLVQFNFTKISLIENLSPVDVYLEPKAKLKWQVPFQTEEYLPPTLQRYLVFYQRQVGITIKAGSECPMNDLPVCGKYGIYLNICFAALNDEVEVFSGNCRPEFDGYLPEWKTVRTDINSLAKGLKKRIKSSYDFKDVFYPILHSLLAEQNPPLNKGSNNSNGNRPVPAYYETFNLRKLSLFSFLKPAITRIDLVRMYGDDAVGEPLSSAELTDLSARHWVRIAKYNITNATNTLTANATSAAKIDNSTLSNLMLPPSVFTPTVVIPNLLNNLPAPPTPAPSQITPGIMNIPALPLNASQPIQVPPIVPPLQPDPTKTVSTPPVQVVQPSPVVTSPKVDQSTSSQPQPQPVSGVTDKSTTSTPEKLLGSSGAPSYTDGSIDTGSGFSSADSPEIREFQDYLIALARSIYGDGAIRKELSSRAKSK